MYDKQFIYEYWSRTELGRAMIKSENISENDLLFLMPNGVKRFQAKEAWKCVQSKTEKIFVGTCGFGFTFLRYCGYDHLCDCGMVHGC